jgi:tetratricopeptide (TPR) repeat protein
MHKAFFSALSFVLPLALWGQSARIEDWTKLIVANKCEEAKKLCTPFLESKVIFEQTEAHKCLSNVVLCGNDILTLQGDDAGGGTIGGGFKPEAVDEALKHLDLGIKLSPQDLSIHQGRLHLLEVSMRYDDMIKALDESCDIYKGKEAPDVWLAYSGELMELRQYRAGLDFMKVLEKHYPENPDILGNIGAFLSLLKKDSEAIPYLLRAAQLDPKDSINAWDLGRTYDYAGQIELADTWYQKGISLETNANRRKRDSCIYAIFVETKLHDRAQACQMEKKDCSEEDQKACATETKTQNQ